MSVFDTDKFLRGIASPGEACSPSPSHKNNKSEKNREKARMERLREFERADNYAQGVVYLITNLQTDEKYVGATARPLTVRWAFHKEQAYAKRGRSALHRAMRQYGRDAFEVRYLASCLDIDCLATLEAALIAQFAPEYNVIKTPDDIWSGRY